ncbi:hypothetical protein AOQ84DRAFT_420555 [Glonium stellatum]|uniref:Uncharacterized protein n=1 Tax=Glonium stellatum TaxID=574774 RepID=A0A8E2JN05_9PEZI|nr:hypothetical protein AOQ84DRAFT_420555 [Glonium stellatum]
MSGLTYQELVDEVNFQRDRLYRRDRSLDRLETENDNLRRGNDDLRKQSSDFSDRLDKETAWRREWQRDYHSKKLDHEQTEQYLCDEEARNQELEDQVQHERKARRELEHELARAKEDNRRWESESRRLQQKIRTLEQQSESSITEEAYKDAIDGWQEAFDRGNEAHEKLRVTERELKRLRATTRDNDQERVPDLLEVPPLALRIRKLEPTEPLQCEVIRGLSTEPAYGRPLNAPNFSPALAASNTPTQSVVLIGHDMRTTPREIEDTGTGWETYRNRRGRRALRNEGDRFRRQYNGF